MKKSIRIAITIVAVAVIGIASYYLLTTQRSGSEEIQQPQGENAIFIENFAYSPKELTISVGETVIWTNRDSVRHNVVSDSGNELAADLLGQNESYTHTFDRAGEYPYHCAPHPFMTGKIVVQ